MFYRSPKPTRKHSPCKGWRMRQQGWFRVVCWKEMRLCLQGKSLFINIFILKTFWVFIVYIKLSVSFKRLYFIQCSKIVCLVFFNWIVDENNQDFLVREYIFGILLDYIHMSIPFHNIRIFRYKSKHPSFYKLFCIVLQYEHRT